MQRLKNNITSYTKRLYNKFNCGILKQQSKVDNMRQVSQAKEDAVNERFALRYVAKSVAKEVPKALGIGLFCKFLTKEFFL